MKRGRSEQKHAERVVQTMFEAWNKWDVFPPLFTRGLQALFFSPVPESISLEGEMDQGLAQKLAKWCSPAHAAKLPYTARLRGLSGSSLSTSDCRARLCHYEQYWHVPGEEPMELDDDDSQGTQQDFAQRL